MKKLVQFRLVFWVCGTLAGALMASAAAQSQDQGASPPTGQRRGPNDVAGQPLVGKITAIKDGAVELAKPGGTSVTVKLTDKTEYRKDRQSAKLGDFKVGEMVFVRGVEDTNHGVTALMIAGRSGNGPEGGGRGFGSGGGGFGELGKDFVVGEVKSVDAPKITVLRPDNVTQTMELNEETSLRKGRESITMADIQPGDYLVVRGGVQNNAFAPKSVMIISLEQWKRMQEMGMIPTGNAPANTPKNNPRQP